MGGMEQKASLSVQNPVNTILLCFKKAETLTLYQSSRSEDRIILVSNFARLQLLILLNRFLSKKNDLGQ